MIKDFLQGRFMKHPLHPLLVHVPVGLWVACFVSDLVFMANGNPNFAVVSYYCILFGLIGAALAVPAGMADFLAIPSETHPKRLATTHMMLNVIVTVLFLINLLSRRGLEDGVPTLITRGQFILTVFSLAILGVSGYLGGLLVYDHGIGFKPQLRGRERAEAPRRVA
ncbi:MAG: DUF2231 domain-containing protein [Oligoflexia bacterium]|nr:DUF2231 domain-containing protein [Oligoflexia bacterium]